MRIAIDDVIYPRAVDAAAALTSGAARRLVISGKRTGEETLAAACLLIHCIKRDGTAKVQDPANVETVARYLVAMEELEGALAEGRIDPASCIEPDKYLRGVVKAFAALGHAFPNISAALTPRPSNAGRKGMH